MEMEAMIRILEVAICDESVGIVYHKVTNVAGGEGASIKSKEWPRPELIMAYKETQELIRKELNIQPVKDLMIKKISLSWKKDMDDRMFVDCIRIRGMITEEGLAAINFTSKIDRSIYGWREMRSAAPEERKKVIKACYAHFDAVLWKLCNEAILYVKGERAQQEFDFDDKGKETLSDFIKMIEDGKKGSDGRQ